MKLEAVLLDKKTQVLTSLGTLIFVVAFSITATYSFTTWKTRFETVQASEKDRLNKEILDRKEADDLINKKLNEVMPMLLETQTDMAEIKTDLKWIRSAMEKNQ